MLRAVECCNPDCMVTLAISCGGLGAVMFYEEAREQINDGDLFLFRGRLLHSKIIQRWTRSVYSHVGVAHWIQSGPVRRLMVIEALEGRGVQMFPLSRYLQREVSVDWFEIVDSQIDRARVVAWAMERLGYRYASPRQFWRSFVMPRRLLEWCGLPTKVDKLRWFCSYFAAESLLNGGWKPDEHDAEFGSPELADPGEVARFTCLGRRGPLVLGKKPQGAV